ncbi:MAG: hypothetical protein M1816_000478 [Peltula sp. TS41687]|nr:MAG: hypothetical protein M1816_000478 [Peltula sp. TS41687]
MASSSDFRSQATPTHMEHNGHERHGSETSSPSAERSENQRQQQRTRRGGQQPGRGGRGGTYGRQTRRPPNSRPPGPGNNKGDPNSRLDGNVSKQQGENGVTGDGLTRNEQEEMEDGSEVEVCVICASPVVHHAVSPCNHRTCHICALRMRALYKTKACAHCRTTSEYVIFTDDGSKHYESFTDADFFKVDENLGVKYEKSEIFEDAVLLLRYNCPDPTCDVACFGWPDLNRHVRNVHHKVMCGLCTRGKKVFTHEHDLFTTAELRKHERFGDDHPGAVDQSGFKGHPECGFCRERFYGDDELYAHCRDRHERCHICDRRSEGRRPQYYVNYDSLEEHFKKDHFLCSDQECLEKKFVVFDSEIDLKAHQLEVHPNGLSKDARREARRIDMSGFDYRTQHSQDGRGNRREGRGAGGRGRDPNAEPVPASTAQPLRRDELAFQRQMAIQSAQSISTRTFGGQLSSSARPQPSGNRTNQVPTPSGSSRAGNADGDLLSLSRPSLEQDSSSALDRSLGSNTITSENLSFQDRARRQRHEAVMERALNLLKHDRSKFEAFRSIVSSYQNTSIPGSKLIDSFQSIFDTSSKGLGKLLNELAEIYETEDKRKGLLQAWNDWKALNDSEDYPALAAGPSGVPANSASSLLGGGGGTRVLKLKSSTAQSSRSAVNRRESWGSQISQTSNGNRFPSLAAATAGASTAGQQRSGAKQTQMKTTTPWTSLATTSSRPSPSPSRQPSSKPPGSGSTSVNLALQDAFPALPETAKPVSTIFGYGFGAVRRDGGRAPATNPWGTGGMVANGNGNGASKDTSQAEPNSDTELSNRKKGKASKKQTLFHFG